LPRTDVNYQTPITITGALVESQWRYHHPAITSCITTELTCSMQGRRVLLKREIKEESLEDMLCLRWQ